MKRHAATVAAVALLVLMAAWMAKPIREESATMDEGLFLAAGYSYCHGFGFAFESEQPPLAKMISAVPLLFMHVMVPPDAQRLLTRQVGLASTRAWSGVGQPVDELFPAGRDNWYFWSYWEADVLGQMFLYSGANDADKLLAAGRWMQVVLTILTGVVIFLWLRRLVDASAGVFGVALWALNPLALAYGHLVLTDMGVTLMILLSVWAWGRFCAAPTGRGALVLGLAAGGALAMKFTAVILVPIFFVTGAVQVFTRRQNREFWKRLPIAAGMVFVVILLVYAPCWKPAPPLEAKQAAMIGVPWWFQALRPVLIPPDFFKGLALQARHAAFGHEAFLCGQWRQTGWWYYFPVVLAWKVPIPLLVLTLTGLALWAARCRRFSLDEATPWVAALVYLAVAMAGTINIGVRHLLPIFPLLAVGTASQFARLSRPLRIAAWILCAWLAAATMRAHPHFIEYFNELAGGSANGYTRLIDSNLDWGQDVKRLKEFLRGRGMDHIYLHYFGPPRAIDYYRIPCTRVTSEQAHDMREGILVVSATALMRPEWNWLRASHEPVARVGYTLFVYRLKNAAG